MTQFTSSAKTITYYIETASTRKLEQMYGSRLERLSQEEKYQLCTAIAIMLWGCVEPTKEVDPDDEFSDLFEAESEPDLINSVEELVTPNVTGNVKACLILLQHEPPEVLAQLLPAIAEYARDDV